MIQRYKDLSGRRRRQEQVGICEHLSLTKLDKGLCHLDDKPGELLCGYLGIEIDIGRSMGLLAQMVKEKNTGQLNW
jgi:hypothetical protein